MFAGLQSSLQLEVVAQAHVRPLIIRFDNLGNAITLEELKPHLFRHQNQSTRLVTRAMTSIYDLLKVDSTAALDDRVLVSKPLEAGLQG